MVWPFALSTHPTRALQGTPTNVADQRRPPARARAQSPTWNDDLISAALDGTTLSRDPLARREYADKGVQGGVMVYYMMHEMDEAAAKIACVRGVSCCLL